MRLALALAASTAALTSLGCGPVGPLTCDRTAQDNPTVKYTEGTVANGVYMTSGWTGELLYFPGGQHYALEHKLGGVPRWISSYLSFDATGATDGGMIAPAAGNQVVILGVNDQVITVANDSCVDYWLLVAAGSGDTTAPPPP
jgi:hypothetical protein